ncbi:hypothetical protein SPTER_04930 [Sporomusa termitida]|uniref:Uncharacterized protein n=1 Tax=Sporomusa termitida TaxID=2377 RepID=A0A517DPC8_9FIRM|nr:hypothetical protein SPTER_04930 [Sporomusa termitida]
MSTYLKMFDFIDFTSHFPGFIRQHQAPDIKSRISTIWARHNKKYLLLKNMRIFYDCYLFKGFYIIIRLVISYHAEDNSYGYPWFTFFFNGCTMLKFY